jgi:hypothetical protein
MFIISMNNKNVALRGKTAYACSTNSCGYFKTFTAAPAPAPAPAAAAPAPAPAPAAAAAAGTAAPVIDLISPPRAGVCPTNSCGYFKTFTAATAPTPAPAPAPAAAAAPAPAAPAAAAAGAAAPVIDLTSPPRAGYQIQGILAYILFLY